jgi:hypothetical protein
MYLVCIEPDCQREFLFTVAEQIWFSDHGLKHPPKRCKSCRQRRREEKER